MDNVFLMPSKNIPTIKGVFVQSHIEALRRQKGDGAVAELERRLGRPLFFRRLADVPVRDEVILIETVYDLLHEGHGLTGAARERAAGRLHFINFCDTTMGSMLMRSLPHTKGSFRTMVCNIGAIARSVFKHAKFQSLDRHGTIVVTLTHTGYPPEHFAGFFEEWMVQWGITSAVQLKRKSPDVHEYTLEV